MRKVKERKDKWKKKKKKKEKAEHTTRFPSEMVVLWHLEPNPSRIKLKNRFSQMCAVCKTQENSERGSGLEANPRPVKMTWDPKIDTYESKPHYQRAARCPEHEQGAPQGKRRGRESWVLFDPTWASNARVSKKIWVKIRHAHHPRRPVQKQDPQTRPSLTEGENQQPGSQRAQTWTAGCLAFCIQLKSHSQSHRAGKNSHQGHGHIYTDACLAVVYSTTHSLSGEP